MLNFIKKQKVGFYLGVVTLILAIVAVSIYSANAKNAYFRDLQGGIIAMSVIAIILQAALLVLPQFLKGRMADILFAVGTVAVVMLLMASVMMFVGARVYDMAILYGSALEQGNDAAYAAMSNAIGGMVVYFIAILCSIVGAFFKTTKEDDSEVKVVTHSAA